jgi:hypothetical protein
LDKISTWSLISEREIWSGVEASQYGVSLQVRTTEDDPNGSPTWTNWKQFVIGEYTARAFQFRLKLNSNEQDVTPSVSKASIEIDVPDRIESGDDITVPSSGATITYNNAFREKPAISVAIDDLDTGDTYTITNKSRTGFDIQFLDNGGSGVQRTFSYVAKGFGKVQ